MTDHIDRVRELIADARAAAASRDDTGWFWVGRLADALERAEAVAVAHKALTGDATRYNEELHARIDAAVAVLKGETDGDG